MKVNIEVKVDNTGGVSPSALLDAVKVALQSVGADVVSLSASNGVVSIVESTKRRSA